MRRIIASLALYVLSLAPVAAAETFSLYTDACYNVEGGDVLGFRIGILRLSDHPYVYFQQAEGDWSAPSIVKGAALTNSSVASWLFKFQMVESPLDLPARSRKRSSPVSSPGCIMTKANL